MIKFNYIDTLYLCKNVGDYSEYLNTVSYFMDLVTEKGAVFMAVAGGRSWYQFKEYKVGVMDEIQDESLKDGKESEAKRE
jgi:hypothetical protein